MKIYWTITKLGLVVSLLLAIIAPQNSSKYRELKPNNKIYKPKMEFDSIDYKLNLIKSNEIKISKCENIIKKNIKEIKYQQVCIIKTHIFVPDTCKIEVDSNIKTTPKRSWLRKQIDRLK